MARIGTRSAAAIRRSFEQVGYTTETVAGAEAAYAVLRPKRQLTLPESVCEKLGIKPGDKLHLTVQGDKLVIKPGKVVAREALRAIQEAFQRSGITEEELLESGRRIREELARERYGRET
ncbi:MAG: AbrB/MazE/SpoVT family DNA-binding domain-containing protein [Chloroflexi bacterium]|nr:AbrB/MazE/SpoVT family DNA-binding domain-containing protein [Chloroflexota bacterium]